MLKKYLIEDSPRVMIITYIECGEKILMQTGAFLMSKELANIGAELRLHR